MGLHWSPDSEREGLVEESSFLSVSAFFVRRILTKILQILCRFRRTIEEMIFDLT